MAASRLADSTAERGVAVLSTVDSTWPTFRPATEVPTMLTAAPIRSAWAEPGVRRGQGGCACLSGQEW